MGEDLSIKTQHLLILDDTSKNEKGKSIKEKQRKKIRRFNWKYRQILAEFKEMKKKKKRSTVPISSKGTSPGDTECK